MNTSKTPIISVRNLSKSYQIGGPREKYKRLSETITDALFHPGKWFSSRTCTQDTFYALRDVSFEVYLGEVVGIIGRNGAGKSTLLKILSGITYPSAGEIELDGRVGSLLEVGTGFHPELTGRENIYFNGSVLGMTRREIDDKFDDIVKFAGIDEFLDTPVKRYSSGMAVRLGFAVAAHLDPEILVVDEVLAVGDAEFQKKCLGKMKEVSEGGRTVLFVSHNMAAVKALCSRAIQLGQGKVQFDGDIHQCIENYSKESNGIKKTPSISIRERNKNLPLTSKIIDIEIMDDLNNTTLEINSTKPFSITLTIEVYKDSVISPQLNIQKNGQNILLFSSELLKNEQYHLTPGVYIIKCGISRCNLTAGVYNIACGLVQRKNEWIDLVFDALELTVVDFDPFSTGNTITYKDSVYIVDHNWSIFPLVK